MEAVMGKKRRKRLQRFIVYVHADFKFKGLL